MQANDFQKQTLNTAIYPGAGSGSSIELYYLALGLTSEAGEVAGKVKKMIRDGNMDTAGMIHEIGDCCYYVARLADALGFSFEDVLKINNAKLMKRKENGTLRGSGDQR